eukprot:g27504.t1
MIGATDGAPEGKTALSRGGTHEKFCHAPLWDVVSRVGVGCLAQTHRPFTKHQTPDAMADADPEKLDEKQKKTFQQVTAQVYAEQAQFFLNAFWDDVGEAEAENIWNWHQGYLNYDRQQFNAIPENKRKDPNAEWSEGSSLDEFWSHKFLETVGKTLTVVEFRRQFKQIDIDFDNRMAFVEYLIWHYKVEKNCKWSSVETMLKRDPQLTNMDLKKAQEALNKVQDEIAKIEKEKNELQKKSEQSGVKGSSAAAALAALLAQDPTDLNRAVVTAEAAVRKAQKSKGPAGSKWWLMRALAEAKKYKPSKGKGSVKK